MRSMMLLALLGLAASPAFAEDSELASSNETPASDAAPVKPDPNAVTEIKEEKPFKIPPGFRTKTRGAKVVYCRADTVSGSRFAKEQCFTEEQLKQKAAENEAARLEMEKSLRICSTSATCGTS
jgi:hypothetical protein